MTRAGSAWCHSHCDAMHGWECCGPRLPKRSWAGTCPCRADAALQQHSSSAFAGTTGPSPCPRSGARGARAHACPTAQGPLLLPDRMQGNQQPAHLACACMTALQAHGGLVHAHTTALHCATSCCAGPNPPTRPAHPCHCQPTLPLQVHVATSSNPSNCSQGRHKGTQGRHLHLEPPPYQMCSATNSTAPLWWQRLSMYTLAGTAPPSNPGYTSTPSYMKTAPLRCFPQQSRPCSCCIPTWICTEIRWGDRHGQLHACGRQVWQALLRAQGHTPGLMLGVDPHTARLCGCNGHKAARHDRAPG